MPLCCRCCWGRGKKAGADSEEELGSAGSSDTDEGEDLSSEGSEGGEDAEQQHTPAPAAAGEGGATRSKRVRKSIDKFTP
jgi:hypothetical protein